MWPFKKKNFAPKWDGDVPLFKVLNTLGKDNKIMAKENIAGVFIRFAGREERNELFSLKWIKVFPLDDSVKVISTNEDSAIFFEETAELKEAVYQRVLQWYINQKSFSGECIMQSDEPLIDAPELLSELADDYFKFQYKRDDE